MLVLSKIKILVLRLLANIVYLLSQCVCIFCCVGIRRSIGCISLIYTSIYQLILVLLRSPPIYRYKYSSYFSSKPKIRRLHKLPNKAPLQPPNLLPDKHTAPSNSSQVHANFFYPYLPYTFINNT